MDRMSISENLETTPFDKGVIVPTLTPFDEHGMVMMPAVTDQARRLSLIDGIFGIAVNTTFRERQSMRQSERLDVLRRTRDGLAPSQLLLACVSELSGDVEDEVEACFRAGADAVISFSNHWQNERKYRTFEAAPFHNLKTDIDNVLSSLAYIAPYEMATLNSASRDGQIHKAQAIHDRLTPLVKLLDGHDANTLEMIYREIAHARCLLASPTARGLTKSLCPHLTASLHSTLDDIALEPISWV